jgi:NAD(P)-dependent dehydrogenase (short-subunit alcohol dehydrogenase family)
VLFAREGAKVAIVYLEEDNDAEDTAELIENEGSDAILLRGDIGDKAFCQEAITETLARFGRIDIVVNNAAEQHQQQDLTGISEDQLERTFRTNVFGYFFLTQAALPHLEAGSTIINTTSVTAYRGSPELIDYAATRGAIVSFTRSLADALAKRKIRVNAVAPGPIWTPLIPASFDAERVEEHGTKAPLGRVGQPNEVAPCHLFLASDESSYVSGQVLHPNGGEVVNG